MSYVNQKLIYQALTKIEKLNLNTIGIASIATGMFTYLIAFNSNFLASISRNPVAVSQMESVASVAGPLSIGLAGAAVASLVVAPLFGKVSQYIKSVIPSFREKDKNSMLLEIAANLDLGIKANVDDNEIAYKFSQFNKSMKLIESYLDRYPEIDKSQYTLMHNLNLLNSLNSQLRSSCWRGSMKRADWNHDIYESRYEYYNEHVNTDKLSELNLRVRHNISSLRIKHGDLENDTARQESNNEFSNTELQM